MLPAEISICGLIEFEPQEARLALRGCEGNDETLHATLLSLAQGLLDAAAGENDPAGWYSESVVFANYEQLAHDLHLIHQRIERKLR
jgi:hypothetical protein